MYMEEYITSIMGECDYQLWASKEDQPPQLIAARGGQSHEPSGRDPSDTNDCFYLRNKEQGCIDFFFRYSSGLQLLFRWFDAPGNEPAELLNLLYPSLPGYYADHVAARQHMIVRKMSDSIKSITALLDLDQLLSQILDNTMTVIPTASVGVLWMYDAEENALTVRTASERFDRSMIGRMRMKPGEGIIGQAFLDGKPRIYRGADAIMRAAANMSEENVHYLSASLAYRDPNYQAVLCVPVKVDSETVCVLILYQMGVYPLFTLEDLDLLHNFADQVAIAIHNARLFSEVQRQNALLVKRDDIHAILMKLSLKNKGPAVILRELERMIERPLYFIDLVEYTVTSSNNRMKSPVSIAAVAQRLGSRREPDTYDEETSAGMRRLHVVPIIAADACLGYVVIELNRELTTLDRIVLEQGRSILSLEMVRKQSQADYYYKKAHDRFHELLALQDLATLRRKGGEMGLEDGKELAAVLFDLPISDFRLMNVQIYRLVALVKKTFQTRAAVVFVLGSKLTMIVQASNAERKLDLKEDLSALFKEWGRSGEGTLRAGAGRSFAGLQSLAASYTEAGKALAYMVSKKRSGFMYYPDIGINQLFFQQSPEELAAFIQQVFGPLRDAGGDGSRLEETLLAYVKTNRSIQQTAESLHIHVNTLYQRMKKIEDALQISFKEPEHMLRLQLACYLYGVEANGSSSL
ncbi:helix-turn-helix domain-containing protein [Cohnella hashimotonis]|uniref:Helix-turn-helix domain-containing protein n=1 Tax=Cohnella hashimotonis TaxID=2826895 RepID=A0ABT6T9K9_9BACL|nr:helix-turn-helix domain-containing protein [Cohnella hashimotonis]MDI4643500.1 helix-turn-helix domain-containing protein [Cohnella hashimotonis]